jgi:KaiC/GvpD/RAD55 family RecA-like ATPase
MTDTTQEFFDQEDAEALGGTGDGKAETGPNGDARGKNPWRELELIHFDDVEPKLDQQWLVHGLIQPEQITVAFGPPGCGKTFFCLDIGLHIAAGVEWGGRRTGSGWVIYLAAEAGRSIKNRIAAWKLSRGYDKSRKVRFAAVTSPVDLCHTKAGDLKRLIAKIQAAVGNDPVALIIIDTVSRVLGGGDENSSEDMGALFGALDQLRDKLHCHVLAIHHCGKDAARGSRGHSLLKGNVDTEIEVTRDSSTRVSTAGVTKQREGEEGEKVSFRLRQVELGRNNDDDPVTSCVVEAIDAPAPRRGGLPTGQAGIAFQQLQNALADNGEKPPNNREYPGVTSQVVTVDLWRSYCERAGMAERDNPESFRQAWKRAKDKLLNGRYIRIWDGRVWIVVDGA